MLGLLLAGGSLAVAALPAGAAAMLEPRGPTAECRMGGNSSQAQRTPGCQSSVFVMKSLPAGEKRVEQFKCPHIRPYFAGWDARVSAGMHATLIGIKQDKKGKDIGAVIRLHEQTDHAAGESRILLGCTNVAPKLVSRVTNHGYHPPQNN